MSWMLKTLIVLLVPFCEQDSDYIERELCEGCYQKMLRGVPLLEKMVLLFNKDGLVVARHYRDDRADTKESKYFEHMDDQKYTMKLEVLKYTKDEHVELKWELICYTRYEQN